ncbi:hypothetical protein HYALB_00013515 [Hymenoscyphus albidus]|uniref:Zn(2)-C6 fungal-type domain-containing protein n=1 Tax=Hymenoscyphus albidus TaxID=595503 RepID=A0A9N9LWL7_9HELO|nr:hypothetical protein HYALB_00013515 [Hymenoscyphus albidus]
MVESPRTLPPLMAGPSNDDATSNGFTMPPPPNAGGSPRMSESSPADRRSGLPPLESMRAYRACLNCRSRKSKCYLEANGGRPPCRRCQREGKDCVLGESHRGGRRVRKKPKLDENLTQDNQTSPIQDDSVVINNGSSSPNNSFSGSSLPVQTAAYNHVPQSPHLRSPPFQHNYGTQPEPTYPWPQQLTPATTLNGSTSLLEGNSSKSAERTGVHENIASVDLQNPSDALDILAQVAHSAEDGESPPSDQPQNQARNHQTSPIESLHSPLVTNPDSYLHYKPVQDGMISPEMIYHLFSSYEEFFHPFFPIIPQETFDRARLPWMSRNEPHLFSAILTVASKDQERVHQLCYDHNQQLVSMILSGADADVEAVEALLLLSQWVSHRPQSTLAVGRGEEDRVAWMYIGTALRLGYFLGIDRTSFKSDVHEDQAIFNRKRLVWSACYICDRQVSVRIGKGFWSRGPGPLSGLRSSDFPTLQPPPNSQNTDDWSRIFQANLELTQIFGNVHDILYSSKGHGWKEMLEGRYTKYLDDFRTSIRNWHELWGDFACSPRLKATLLLTYEYLRLYVNAFAYQATISRALTFQRDSQRTQNRPMQLIDASASDARFIYEALDAAKSLLSTFNTFVDPETLRYMPSSYYLYIIYSAVFLYKARSTTTMTEEERTVVRQMIQQTISRLEKASVGANGMGSRYARLLQLLWRKAPHKRMPLNHPNHDPTTTTTNYPLNPANQTPYEHTGFAPIHLSPNGHDASRFASQPRPAGPGTFSWLDLDATWNFATQNNGSTLSQGGDSVDTEKGVGGMGMDVDGMSPSNFNFWDMGLLSADYSLLEGDNPNLLF